MMMPVVSSFVLCAFLCATTSGVPVASNATGLGAALTNIANSFVVVSEEQQQTVSSRIDTEAPTVPHLESANVLPALMHIALTPEEHHIKAHTEELVYTNKTDAQGVVKITIVEKNSSEELTTDEAATEEYNDDDDDTTTDEITTETEDGLTTVVPSTTGSPTLRSTTPTAILTVLGNDQVDKEKEEEIKQNIKEVEAMPVILTVGV
ncbi:uncharacterized protein LOC128304517 [Anopheles moucheti]|uniref:uncharacterized protein LOC128304517 n=1 Tax=Anopheles moucheti TaxID=186751 RepID=UPI0022F046D3|nr:uncharacterized protein LOC128304517 [Anopheles moucheti]